MTRSVSVIAALMLLLPHQQEAPGLRLVERNLLYVAGPTGGFVSGVHSVGNSILRIALKGDRLAVGNAFGVDIVDAREQKSYLVDPLRKEFVAQTFSELKRQYSCLGRDWQRIEQIDSQMADLFMLLSTDLPKQSRSRARQFEFQVQSSLSDGLRMVAGHNAREVTLTLRAFEKGKTLERDGGWFVTSRVLLTDPEPAIDALAAFRRHEYASLSDEPYGGVDALVDSVLDSVFPEFHAVATRLVAEVDRMQGTIVAQFTNFEMVRTADEVKRAASQEADLQSKLGGPSNIRLLGGPPPQRTTLVTLEREILSFAPLASASDVSIPEGFRVTTNPMGLGRGCK